MFEVLSFYMGRIERSNIHARLGLREREYFVVSAHREENIDSEKHFAELMNSLNVIVDTYRFPVIVSTHPRTRKRIESAGLSMRSDVQFLRPMGFSDYNALQRRAFAVLSDSGTISE